MNNNKNKSRPLLKLSDYHLQQAEVSLSAEALTVSAGEVWRVTTDCPASVNLFFKALATLVPPHRGRYLFDGVRLDFSSNEKTLWCKKQIGYISPHISLISNRTLEDNLLLPRAYEENTRFPVPDQKLEKRCQQFHLTPALQQRVTQANHWDTRIALAIRELQKQPRVLLLERPEEIISPDRQQLFIKIAQDQAAAGTAILLFSYDHRFVDALATGPEIFLQRQTAASCALPRGHQERQATRRLYTKVCQPADPAWKDGAGDVYL